jgi:hypothetical protein
MSNAAIDQCAYGQLRVAIDEGVEWFALAPDATLTDIANVFLATVDRAPRRLLSVRISILSAP